MGTLSIMLLLLHLGFGFLLYAGANKQHTNDGFDDIRKRMDKVDANNCGTKDINDLYLPQNAISHLIDIKEIYINPIFANRTALWQLHNMALTRSFFYSYVLQTKEPQFDSKLVYYFSSTVADVSANPSIKASAIYFAPYSVSNETLPLFAPRTFRSNRDTFDIRDLGSIFTDIVADNYTNSSYKINEWYGLWLPDNITNVKQSRYEKTQYQVTIRYADNKNETSIFFGPPGTDEIPGPVKYTRPYFDCGRSNKWLVAAVVPIVGVRLAYPKYIATSVTEMEFETIDINQCPAGSGNSGPNIFADTALCKKETTECEPLHGFGLRRGGYQCRCKPGYRRPLGIESPYLGVDLESASDEEYNNGFDCIKIESPQDLPIDWDVAPISFQEKYLNAYSEYRNPKTGVDSLHEEKLNIDAVLNFIYKVQRSNCHDYNFKDLILPPNFTYGAKTFYENEANAALRLANFISAYIQLYYPVEWLTENQMYSEALALVLGNQYIWSAGIYWEPNTFSNRTLFAPFAYKKELNLRKFNIDDMARLNEPGQIYTEKEWYSQLKKHWSENNPEHFAIRIETSDYSYVSPNLESGYWTSMYYDCDGPVNRWLITYAAPFFGWDEQGTHAEFKGVVAISTDALRLDINQCNGETRIQNAFKGTHKCDESTTHCVPIPGRQFYKGGYKCECLQGYEYPFKDLTTYFEGELVENEFENLVQSKPTRYDIFQCRVAGSGSYIPPNVTLFHMHASNSKQPADEGKPQPSSNSIIDHPDVTIVNIRDEEFIQMPKSVYFESYVQEIVKLREELEKYKNVVQNIKNEMETLP